MASKAALKIQRDKEMAAMMYNTKEQRVLEKSLQTLHLEQTYALKLLELDNRIIKVRYKKLKENVSKIKSHLPVDDISKYRDLDLQGKLGPNAHSGVNLGSALKIAAAARRLNLGASSRRRGRGYTRSALPIIAIQREAPLDMRGNSVDPPTAERVKRPNSVSGAFIDAPDDDDNYSVGSGGRHRPTSAINLNHTKTNGLSTPQTNGKPPPARVKKRTCQSAVVNGSHKGNQNDSRRLSHHINQTHAPQPHIPNGGVPQYSQSGAQRVTIDASATLDDFTRIKSTLSVPNLDERGRAEDSNEDSEDENPCENGNAGSNPPTFRSSSSVPHPRPRSPFSSHSPATRDMRARMASAPARPSRRLSHISNDSIDSNLGESGHEERRQELLEEESLRAATLDQRTKIFLQDVDDYLLKNPPLQASHVAFEADVREPPRRDSLLEPAASSGQAGRDPARGNSVGRSVRFRQRRGEGGPGSELDPTPTFFPEAEYKERLMGLWKDMNKCRYLRVADEKIDLSGVNTLVKDQMKLFETLKQAEREPLRRAWET